MEPKLLKLISRHTGVNDRVVTNVVSLLQEGATIPFIARYRKEKTQSLDEVGISNIQKEYQRLLDLVKRKETIKNKIDEQGSLTPELQQRINNCWETNILEDIYLPFKKKIKTKASVARENGLEPLAKIIMAQRDDRIKVQAKRFISGNIKNIDDAISGAKHIIAEWINENDKTRNFIRNIFEKSAWIESKEIKKKEGDKKFKYRDYFDYQESLSSIPSHRLLAVLRGEKEGYLKSKVDIDTDYVNDRVSDYYIHSNGDAATYIEEAVQDALKRLLLPAIRNEALKAAKEKADEQAINVFAKNAKELLLSPPLGNKKIVGIDPGFRTGCKVVVLGQNGELIKNLAIYPHPPQREYQKASSVLANIFSKYGIEAVAVGNGTAGKETYRLVKEIVHDTGIEVYLVNEDGASIYSASEIARDEFPDHDITVRGAVSIARRLMDPLSELVKIDPKSIGVGQYQHDVNQKKLKENLTETVVSCVNTVGVNINTASPYVLSYISGLGPTLAKNIVTYRSQEGEIKSVASLKKVPRMGAKAFEQCAGFLRVKNAKNPLDDTGVHPESYHIVKQMATDQNTTVLDLIAKPELTKNINLSEYITADIGIPTLQDIIKEINKPGLDPRGKAKALQFKEGINAFTDLIVGMELSGIVVNLTKFGAFVDIGIKESGLIHISQITNKFIKDPSEVLSINQTVSVKIIDIDSQRKRVSLTMKF